MKTFSQFKKEIKGLEDVKETVEAEEKISSANIHFLFKENEHLKEYLINLEKIISHLIVYFGNYQSVLGEFLTDSYQKGEDLLIVIGGDKGLTGGLWQKISEAVEREKRSYSKIIVYGKRTSLVLKEKKLPVFKEFSTFSNLPLIEEIDKAFKLLEDLFVKNRIRKIPVLYPSLLTLAKIEPRLINFLPLEVSLKKDEKLEKEPGLPIFEGGKKRIFKELIRSYLKLKFFQIVWESKLAEFLSRAMTMEKSSEEVKKMIKRTTYNFFRTRRKILTKNQIEVFAGHKVARRL